MLPGIMPGSFIKSLAFCSYKNNGAFIIRKLRWRIRGLIRFDISLGIKFSLLQPLVMNCVKLETSICWRRDCIFNTLNT